MSQLRYHNQTIFFERFITLENTPFQIFLKKSLFQKFFVFRFYQIQYCRTLRPFPMALYEPPPFTYGEIIKEGAFGEVCKDVAWDIEHYNWIEN